MTIIIIIIIIVLFYLFISFTVNLFICFHLNFLLTYLFIDTWTYSARREFIVIIINIIFYVYVFSRCAGLAEKRIRFPQGLSLALYLHFRIFLFLYC